MTETDKLRFLQAFMRLAIAMREKADTDGTVLRVYFDALKDCEIEFLEAAVEPLSRAGWFPKANDWRHAARAVERQRRDAQATFLRRLPRPLCAECRDTGWAEVGNGEVRRCACAHQRRLELLGRAPLPGLQSHKPGKGDRDETAAPRAE